MDIRGGFPGGGGVRVGRSFSCHEMDRVYTIIYSCVRTGRRCVGIEIESPQGSPASIGA